MKLLHTPSTKPPSGFVDGFAVGDLYHEAELLERHVGYEINNVEFGVNDPEQYKAKAREVAIKNAIQQASSVAKGFGADLGAVYSVSYRAPEATPYPIARMKMDAMALNAGCFQGYGQEW